MPYNKYRSAYHAGPSTNKRRPGSSSFGGSNQRRSSGGKRRGQYIDPSRFVKAAVPVVAGEEYVPMHTFAEFEVNDLLKANIAAKGYTSPSPIQDQTIPVALEGYDVIGIANTGTGKTAAFALPALHQLMTFADSRALIVAPTRELAQQIEQECRSIAKGSGLTGALLIGGSAMGPQLRDLRNKPRIVIGTPGRIKDHQRQGTLNLANFNIAVLDEVDRMLDMGFVNDVQEILNSLSAERQSFFFSATLDTRVKNLIHSFAKDPVTISLKVGETADSVNQDVVRYSGSHEKMQKLHDVLLGQGVEKAIVFDETQRGVERLSNELVARGFDADAIHGGKSQGQRQRALDKFKQNKIKILVATDVAARGIDVKDITHVINYGMPQSYEDYVHRVGRAGRAGKTGHALTFVEGA
ncbi:MAG: DEAD/DEAH box helicase [Candidatus Saccharimonadales bacterium]